MVSMACIESGVDSSHRLEQLCHDRQLFCTPDLNRVLFLNHAGLLKVPRLSKYINVKCLYLNNNGLHEIVNLNDIPDLECVFIQVRGNCNP